MKTFLKCVLVVALCHINMWYLCSKYGTRVVYGYVVNSSVLNEEEGSSHVVTIAFPDSSSKTYRNRRSILLHKGTKQCEAVASVTALNTPVKLTVNGFGEIIHAEKFVQTVEQDIREANIDVGEVVR